jgi:hypothetical protein
MSSFEKHFRRASAIRPALQNICRSIANIALLAELVAACALPAFASPQAMSLKDLPEDARASITKELARKNRQQDAQGTEASGDGTGAAKAGGKNGCTMDVGSQNQPSPGARRVVTVVTGPLVQICK